MILHILPKTTLLILFVTGSQAHIKVKWKSFPLFHTDKKKKKKKKKKFNRLTENRPVLTGG